jgi:hypothetical protein
MNFKDFLNRDVHKIRPRPAGNQAKRKLFWILFKPEKYLGRGHRMPLKPRKLKAHQTIPQKSFD